MKEGKYFFNSKKEEFVDVAIEYAMKNGLVVDKELNNGEWGLAFLLNNNTVLKVTTDPAEAYNAMDLQNKVLDNVAQIYNVDFKDDFAIIEMEYVSTNMPNFEELYYSTYNKIQEADQSFYSFDKDALDEYDVILTNEEMKLAIDISEGVNQIYANKAVAEDVYFDNIGLNSKGNYVVFDQKSVSIEPAEFILKIEERIKKKDLFNTLNQPNIDENKKHKNKLKL